VRAEAFSAELIGKNNPMSMFKVSLIIFITESNISPEKHLLLFKKKRIYFKLTSLLPKIFKLNFLHCLLLKTPLKKLGCLGFLSF